MNEMIATATLCDKGNCVARATKHIELSTGELHFCDHHYKEVYRSIVENEYSTYEKAGEPKLEEERDHTHAR